MWGVCQFARDCTGCLLAGGVPDLLINFHELRQAAPNRSITWLEVERGREMFNVGWNPTEPLA